MVTIHTFGDSILDCGGYNEFLLDPGRLLIRNEDTLFPEFRGHDLSSLGPARLAHHAVDGSTVDDLEAQMVALDNSGEAIALLTVGGNDLLMGLLHDRELGIDGFAAKLNAFLQDLPIRPVLIGNVYDPTFGDDALNVFGIDPSLGRENHRKINAVLADLGSTYGSPVDLHRHFLLGEPDWFVRTIEPSLTGASEIRRCFFEVIEAAGLVGRGG